MAAARAIRGWDAMDQDARTARAMSADYEWSLSPAGPWVCETPEGKCYEVTQHGCSCPDHQHRCSKVGGLCKHRIVLAHKMLAEGTDLALQALEAAAAQDDNVPCEECGVLIHAEEMAREIHEECGTVYVCPDCDERSRRDRAELQNLPGFDPFADEAPGPAGPEAMAQSHRLTRRDREAREDAAFDRLYGGA